MPSCFCSEWLLRVLLLLGVVTFSKAQCDLPELTVQQYGVTVPEISVTVGARLSLVCVADFMALNPLDVDYLWQKSGVTVEGPGTISQFTIESLQTSDGGVYRCGVVFECGSDTETVYSADVVVNIPAVITQMNDAATGGNSTTVTEGDSFELACYADGWPEPNIEWLHPNGSLVVTGNTYTNPSASLSDSGVYTCRAVNGYNDTEYHPVVVEATQQKPPTIVTDPDNVQTLLSQTISLTCEAVGEPNPTYSWYRDGLFLVNTTQQELFIAQARPQDRGEYTCVAHNVHGSSNVSSPALVTISGVFQYIANFSDCTPATDFVEQVSLFSNCSSGRVLQTTRSTVYSISPRLVRMGSSPEDQIVLTIVANSSTTEGIMEDLWVELNRITEKFQCQFSHLRRYDGCPMEDYVLNQEFDVVVTWAESEIGDEEHLDCPCGNITGSLGDVGLDRVCGGTYLYGAFWNQTLNDCNFQDSTFELCSITTLSAERQAAALGEAMEEASVFSPLEFTIAATIMQDLTLSPDIQTNVLVQTNFTRSFSNLLGTSEESVAESQEKTQSSALLLDSLEQFTQRILLNSTDTFSVNEDNFQIVIQDQAMADFAGLTYTPDVDPYLQEFQQDATRTPVQGASISLPGDLESFLQNDRSTLRVSTLAIFKDTLFVQNRTSELAMDLARGNRTLGNIIISASLPQFEKVDGPTVVIRYTLTEGLQQASLLRAECVFWLEESVYGTWSNRGCRLVGIDEGVVTCECTHLTHFGLLMDISPEPHEDEGVGVSLQVITYVGVVLSVICLMIVLLTYCCSRKLRSRPVGKLLIQMSTALIGLYVSFLLAMHGEQYDSIEGFCYFCSFVLQYFFLVFLLWTSIEAFHTYLQLVRVFGADISRFVLKASLVAWGLPALITIITLAVGLPIDQYITKVDGDLFFCRPVKWPFYFGIAAPFVLIFVFNVAIFFVVMWSLTRSTSQQKKWTEAKQMSKEYKKLAVIAFTLSVLFGLGWAFGFLIPTNLHSDGVVVSTIAQYIFSILVGFHGVLIFLVYCLRSPEVRQEWSRWFVKYGCCFKPTKPPRTLTQTTGSKPRITLESPSGEKGFLHLGDKRNPIFDGEDDFSMRQRLNTSFNNNSNSEFASTWFTGEVSTHGNPTAEILEGEEDGTSGGEPLIK